MDDQKQIAKTEKKTLVDLYHNLIEIDFDDPKNADLIEKLFAELGDKVERYVAFEAYSQSQIGLYKNEMKFQKSLIDKTESAIERLKKTALLVMKGLGTEELIGAAGHKMQIKKSKYVEVINIEEIPNDFKKPTFTAIKTAIREAVEAGNEVPGAKLLEREGVLFK